MNVDRKLGVAIVAATMFNSDRGAPKSRKVRILLFGFVKEGHEHGESSREAFQVDIQ